MSCLAPMLIKNSHGFKVGEFKYVPVPCGTCAECLKRHALGWVARLKQEEKRSTSAWFITLTYAEDSIDSERKLVKSDLQKYFKRVRKTERNIKYYACGEYGGTTDRPHYHAIVFNASSQTLATKWEKNGFPYIEKANGATMAYVCGYVNKKLNKDERAKREFVVMSKGLGDNYLSKDMVKWHQDDISRNYIVMEGGIKTALPRYYKDKIYKDGIMRKQQNKLMEQRVLEEMEFKEIRFRKMYGNEADFVKYNQECKMNKQLKRERLNRLKRQKI